MNLNKVSIDAISYNSEKYKYKFLKVLIKKFKGMFDNFEKLKKIKWIEL